MSAASASVGASEGASTSEPPRGSESASAGQTLNTSQEPNTSEARTSEAKASESKASEVEASDIASLSLAERADEASKPSKPASLGKATKPSRFAKANDDDKMNLLRPPVPTAMRTLDRAFFQKRVRVAAARVMADANISLCRGLLRRDLFPKRGIKPIVPVSLAPSDAAESSVEQPHVTKAILLRPGIESHDPSTWPPSLQSLAQEKVVTVMDWNINLDYDSFTYDELATAILPEVDTRDDVPSGFSAIGHIAHLNLRDAYVPHGKVIGELLLDKNPCVRTVINKREVVGATSRFRTFEFDLLAGEPNYDVEVSFRNCSFKFNYAKVYWNPRLHTEHERLVDRFQPGEAICDVMAGCGPFAVPAGKKGCFVFANDLNPNCFDALADAVKRNKVSPFVEPRCLDARDFIRTSTRELRFVSHFVDQTPKFNWKKHKRLNGHKFGGSKVDQMRQASQSQPRVFLHRPRSFHHFVLNLPATAIEYLDAFIGLHTGHEEMFTPHTDAKLPMIHVYSFASANIADGKVQEDIIDSIGKRLQYDLRAVAASHLVDIYEVRAVSPSRRMFCTSFQLPKEVAFRKPSGT